MGRQVANKQLERYLGKVLSKTEVEVGEPRWVVRDVNRTEWVGTMAVEGAWLARTALAAMAEAGSVAEMADVGLRVGLVVTEAATVGRDSLVCGGGATAAEVGMVPMAEARRVKGRGGVAMAEAVGMVKGGAAGTAVGSMADRDSVAEMAVVGLRVTTEVLTGRQAREAE